MLKKILILVALTGIAALGYQSGYLANNQFSPLREELGGDAEDNLFANVSYQSGISYNRLSFDHAIGTAWGDYDNDGWVDLYVTDSGYPNTLYHNEGDGTFTVSPLNKQVGLDEFESGGAIFADYNNDGWQDLLVVGWGPNTLFMNDAGERFVDVTLEAGLADKGENSKSGSWGDYDQDGYLDLYIANWACYPRCGRPATGELDKFYHNNGDGTFTNVTRLLPAKTTGAGFIASFTDFDNDGDLDIYLVNDEFIYPIGNALWRNDGPGCDGWCFTEISTDSGADASLMGMGLAPNDYDNDGDFDYYFSNAGPMGFLQNQGDGTFKEVAAQIGVDAPLRVGFGMIAFDYDNDMWQDLYLAVPAYVGGDDVAANPLFHNNGDGTFSRVQSNTGAADVGATLGVAYADYNQDGWLDFVIGSFNQGYELFKNQAVSKNHWLVFELEGDGKNINRDAVGTKIIVTTPDGAIQTRELQAGASVGAGSELILHFGLGTATKAKTVTVIWPDNTTQTFSNVVGDRRIQLPYPLDDAALQAQADALAVNHPANPTVAFGAILLAILFIFIYRMMTKKTSIFLLLMLGLGIAGCSQPADLDRDLGLLLSEIEVVQPEELPTYDPAMLELGQALFWDPLLGGNRDTACVTCHHPALGTSDGLPLAIGTGATGLGPDFRHLGTDREFVPRNATEIYNRNLPGWTTMFWDIRVFAVDGVHFGSPAAYRLPQGLDNVVAVQAMFPVTSGDEMMGDRGNLDIFGEKNELAAQDGRYVERIWEALMVRVLAEPEYAAMFAEVFPDVPADELGFEHAANAIAAYEMETFTFLDAPFDRYLLGDTSALSDDAKRGAILFYGEAQCSVCHSGLLMTDQKAHNLAVPMFGPGKGVQDDIDPGVMLVTGERSDRYSFRTPPLRNIALTAPYYHNGAYDDLRDVIEQHLQAEEMLYAYTGESLSPELRATIVNDPDIFASVLEWLDPTIADAPDLSDEEIDYLLAFLDSLTSPTAQDWEQFVPDSVPSGLDVGGAIE